MNFWRENVDDIITFNKKKLLIGRGNVNNEQMEEIVDEVNHDFNIRRKNDELTQADAQDNEELKQLEEKIKKNRKNKPVET